MYGSNTLTAMTVLVTCPMPCSSQPGNQLPVMDELDYDYVVQDGALPVYIVG